MTLGNSLLAHFPFVAPVPLTLGYLVTGFLRIIQPTICSKKFLSHPARKKPMVIRIAIEYPSRINPVLKEATTGCHHGILSLGASVPTISIRINLQGTLVMLNVVPRAEILL